MMSGLQRFCTIAFALLFGLAGALGGGAVAAADTIIELELVSWDGQAGQEVIRRALDEFEAQNPGIRVSNRQMTNYKDSLIVQLASGIAPDVYLVGDWDYPEFWYQDMTADLTPYIDRFNIDKEQWIPTILASHTIDGRIHVLPKDFSTIATLYNVDHFVEAGLSLPHDDWTWDEAREMARALTRVSDGEVVRHGISASPTWSNLLWAFPSAAGAPIMDPELTTFTGHLNSPESIAALQFALDLVMVDGVSPHPRDGSDVNKFVNQELSAVLWGPWGMLDWQTLHPELNFAVAPAPRYDQGRTTALMQAGWAVNPNIEDPARAEAAARVVLFLGGPQGQAHMAGAGWAIPATPATAAELGMLNDPNWRPFFNAAYEVYTPYWTHIPEFSRVLGNRWGTMINEVLSGDKALRVGIEEIIGPAENTLQEVRADF